MQTHITQNNRLASIGTIGLLFLAGIAGMVFLFPASPVNGASAAVTLSTEKSGVLTAATSGTVGSNLVITGTGFVPDSTVTISSTVGSTSVSWFTGGATCVSGNGIGTANSLTVTASGHTCLTTTASGGFQTTVAVPALPGGAETIVVSDGTNSVSAPFNITPSLTLTTPGNNFGFPEESLGSSTFAATGFGAAEVVTLTGTAFTTASMATTTCTTNAFGSCNIADSLVIADQNSGTPKITATGGTSSLTAFTTITVNPWVAFYNSQTGGTTYSFPGQAPTSILVEAHGLPAGTLAANSITIGPVGTTHAAETIGTNGGFGGAKNQLVVAPAAQVPFGPENVVIDGITFNYATGNIALGAGTWGGVLISSITGVPASSTAVVSTDASSYKPGTGFTPSTTSPAPAQNQVAFFGYGFVTTGSAIVITAGGSGLSAVSFKGTADCTSTCDANGALFGIATLGDTPWSSSSTPTTAAQYSPGISQSGGPANFLPPTFGVTAWNTIGTSAVDYTTTGEAVTVHGFSNTEGITVTIGGSTLTTATCTTGTTGTATCTASSTVPDLAGGAQSVVAKGSLSGVTATTASGVIYSPNVSGTGSLSLYTGAPGTTTILRTGATAGPHGLAANTAYDIVWNSQGGSQTLGTFTSTATGGVPIPGVQVTTPSDASGYHTIDIKTTSGASGIYGSTLAGDTTPTVPPPAGQTLTSQYGDLVFSLSGLLTATPGVASVGLPEALSGSGLTAGTEYVVSLCAPASGCPLGISNSVPALATFTATAAGAVPSGTSITLTDTPTTTETGTVNYLAVQTAGHFGVSGTTDGYAKFILAASGSDNMTSGPTGHGVTFNAHALNANGIYDLIFNYVQSPLNSAQYTGTTVGVVSPNALGAGSISWNVPASAVAGQTYTVQLVVATQGTGGLVVGSPVLNVPQQFTVGGTSGSCNTTSCISVSGTPTLGQQGAYKGISTSFTNNSNAPVTAFAYAVVHNSLGQTVAISTATITAGANGGSATGFNVLFGLAPATYTVSIFVVSSGGTAISTSTPVTVTIS